MRVFLTRVCYCVIFCVSLASADSIQLRNGRRLEGKYIGGTTTMIGFMTAGDVEYFSTSEVLVLMFDGNASPPLSGFRPNPMKGAVPRTSSPRHLRRISVAGQCCAEGASAAK